MYLYNIKNEIKMETFTINGKTYGANRPAGMSDKAFKSYVLRNDITPEKINALKASIERGKELVSCQY